MKVVKNVTLELRDDTPLSEVVEALTQIAEDVKTSDPNVIITDDYGVSVTWEVQF